MTITTYAGLQAAVADWVERGDLTSRLPTFIANAEAKANRLLRERRQQGQSTANVSTAMMALPSDFREAITIELRTDSSEPYSRLEPVPSDMAATLSLGLPTGRPRFWSVLGDELHLHPAPDGTYALRMAYFAKVPALSDGNPSNWLLQDGPDIYLDGALAAFHEWDQDWEAANRYFQKFETGLAELIAQRRGPGPKLRTDLHAAGRGAFDIFNDA